MNDLLQIFTIYIIKIVRFSAVNIQSADHLPVFIKNRNHDL